MLTNCYRTRTFMMLFVIFMMANCERVYCQSFTGISALVAVSNGDTKQLVEILQEGRKFREINYPSVKSNSAISQRGEIHHGYYFDDSEPKIVWFYHGRLKNAAPTPPSALNLLAKEVEKDGESVVRKKYNIHPTVPTSTITQRSKIQPNLSLKFTTQALPGTKWVRKGNEKVCGHICTRYFMKATTPDGSSFENEVWVEPKNQWILKSVEVATPPRNQRFPTLRIVKEVVSVKFLRNIPLRDFQLPAGTKALIGDLYRSVKTPSDVIRYRKPEKEYQVGGNLSVPMKID